PLQQSVAKFKGHAVEARLYAEDPLTFLPQAGRIEHLRLPNDIRVDTGVEEGDEIPVAYDPMIAKLIAHGPTREEALYRLRGAVASDSHGGRTESSSVAAPMPGTVIRVLVSPGDKVKARQPLVVLEAMKMETPLTSPHDATVRAVHVEEGASVAAGALLVELQD